MTHVPSGDRSGASPPSGPAGPDEIPDRWPLPDVEFTVDARTTALVIVDMQYYDAHPGRGIGQRLEEASPGYTRYYFERIRTTTVPAIQRLLAFFRSRAMRVVFVTYASETDDGSDLNPLLRARNEQRKRAIGVPSVYPKSAPEAAILEEIRPLPGELVVNKTSQSAFNSTAIDVMLRNLGIDTVLVTGVVTNVCVEATARDAADRGLRTVLVDEACAAWEESFHRATLRSFRKFLGRVASVDAILAELSSGMA